MSEEQIKDGYDRLDSAVHPPQDAFDRVERRMGVRRRRRRAGLAAGTAVAVAAFGGIAVASLGGSDDGREGMVAVDPPPYSLVMTRPDGSTYEFADLTISCDPPDVAGETGATDNSRIYLSSPIQIEGENVTEPFVMIEGVVAKLQEPRTFALPVDGTDGSSESMPLTVFIADNEGSPDGNEVVSTGNSSGTVRVLKASCDPTPVLQLEVDATLASEELTADGKAKQSLQLEGYVD